MSSIAPARTRSLQVPFSGSTITFATGNKFELAQTLQEIRAPGSCHCCGKKIIRQPAATISQLTLLSRSTVRLRQRRPRIR